MLANQEGGVAKKSGGCDVVRGAKCGDVSNWIGVNGVGCWEGQRGGWGMKAKGTHQEGGAPAWETGVKRSECTAGSDLASNW